MKSSEFTVRPALQADLASIIEIDAEVTGVRKLDYWYEMYARYGGGIGRQQRFFLVAERRDGEILGFILGDVRDWEFGSPPCGWVFGLSVLPAVRESGVASEMLDAICERFRRSGVTTVRTLLARDNHLVMAFFRSQGMMAAPFIALERTLDE